jgi:hypothetical protein
MTDAFGVNKSLLDVVRPVKRGAQAAQKVKLVPAQPGNFVHWDPVKAKALLDPATKKAVATQQERYATRMSFGKSDAFGVEHVSKGAGAQKVISRGRTLTLKAKEAPVKAQVNVLSAGDKLVHSSKRGRRAMGAFMQQIGYRPDYLGMAAASLPKTLLRTA